MRCTVCFQAPELKRDKEDANYAKCPKCGLRVPNFDGKIKFRGRPKKETAPVQQ